MEDILASIRKYVSGDEERKHHDNQPFHDHDQYQHDVIRLTESYEIPHQDDFRQNDHHDPRHDQPILSHHSSPIEQPPYEKESILKDETIQISSRAFEALHQASQHKVGSVSLETFFMDIAKPMIAKWLDENLPTLVENLIAKEISKITGLKE